MKAIVTYCSAAKNTAVEPLPAWRRYLSERIVGLRRQALAEGAGFFILSGRHGLLPGDRLILWYDHLLLGSEVSGLVPAVAASLQEFRISQVIYHTADPLTVAQVSSYWELISGACRGADLPLQRVTLPGDPA